MVKKFSDSNKNLTKIIVVDGGNIGTLLCAVLMNNNRNVEVYLHTRDVSK